MRTKLINRSLLLDVALVTAVLLVVALIRDCGM